MPSFLSLGGRTKSWVFLFLCYTTFISDLASCLLAGGCPRKGKKLNSLYIHIRKEGKSSTEEESP
jgi:hypothetical protein